LELDKLNQSHLKIVVIVLIRIDHVYVHQVKFRFNTPSCFCATFVLIFTFASFALVPRSAPLLLLLLAAGCWRWLLLAAGWPYTACLLPSCLAAWLPSCLAACCLLLAAVGYGQKLRCLLPLRLLPYGLYAL
jgi:hypothetical protein